MLDDPINYNLHDQVVTLPTGTITIPSSDFTMLGKQRLVSTLNSSWLLFDGGSRSGIKEQTTSQVKQMKEAARRTDLEIIDSVKRLYWGAVMARKIHKTGQDTLERMQVTLDLTQSLYQNGSGSVKKTDWLNNKVMVSTIRSMVASLEKNELATQAALANTMGLPWNSSIVPADDTIAVSPCGLDVNTLVSKAYSLNTDWTQLDAELEKAHGALKNAKSGYMPKLAFTGRLFHWKSDQEVGLATAQNESIWELGLNLSIPIFEGGLTRHKIAEMRANIARIKEQQLLLKESIGLQVSDILLSIGAVEKSLASLTEAVQDATENRELNSRAYQIEMVNTDDVIHAQFLDALMQAQLYKVQYEHRLLLSRLNLVVGSEVLKNIN